MTKLFLYGIFHANLNFSYIAPDLYPQIVRLCYRPLLEFVNQTQIPLAFEMSGKTLQTVNQIDPDLVELLKELWRRGTCQFIGSGYVQSIMPLIPARANNENLQHGNQIYEAILGNTPNMAFVNEQVYSRSLPSIYRDNGYDSLVINWDSSSTKNAIPELVYQPCSVNADTEIMPIVWHYTEAYRAVQNYVEQKSSLTEYIDWFNSNIDAKTARTMAFYSSDWDVFDFKPWDSYPDGFPSPYHGEMKRLTDLISHLNNRDDVEFVAPNTLLNIFSDHPLVTPESASNPLPYKKQDQHGILRWAVGGRESGRYNTQCYLLYQKLLSAEATLNDLNKTNICDEIKHLWRELCFLWNSDFRTFTTEEKNLEFRNRMGAALHNVETILDNYTRSSNYVPYTEISPNYLDIIPIKIRSHIGELQNAPNANIALDMNNDIFPCQITNDPSPAGYTHLMGTANFHYLDLQNARIIYPHTLRETERYVEIDPTNNKIRTPSAEIDFEPSAGGGISKILFPTIFKDALVTKPENHISPCNPDCLGALADINIVEWDGNILNDHSQTDIIYPEETSQFNLFVPVFCRLRTDFAVIWKTYRIYIDIPRIDINIRLQLKDLVPRSFRLGTMNFNSKTFNREELKYTTTNGGLIPEQFQLRDDYFNHAEPMNEEVTARTSIGATEGWIVISDSEKGVGLVTDQTSIYSTPMVNYQKTTSICDPFNLSVVHSLDEHDPTSHTLWRGHTLWGLSVIGGKSDIISLTRSSAHFMNKTIANIGSSSIV